MGVVTDVLANSTVQSRNAAPRSNVNRYRRGRVPPAENGSTEMAQKETRIIITMACTECRSRNYTTSKNRIKHQNRLELKKYCPRPSCRRHTLHREAK